MKQPVRCAGSQLLDTGGRGQPAGFQRPLLQAKIQLMESLFLQLLNSNAVSMWTVSTVHGLSGPKGPRSTGKDSHGAGERAEAQRQRSWPRPQSERPNWELREWPIQPGQRVSWEGPAWGD